MALINRVSRLFRADFHAVLDRIEEPDVLLKQALREMEEEIHNDETHLKLLQNEFSQVELKQKETEENIEQIELELDVCFNSNEDKLARSQIRRKIEMQRYKKHLNNKSESIDKAIDEIKTRLQKNKTRFATMQQKLELLIEVTPSQSDEYFPAMDMSIHDDEVEVAYLREKQARTEK